MSRFLKVLIAGLSSGGIFAQAQIAGSRACEERNLSNEAFVIEVLKSPAYAEAKKAPLVGLDVAPHAGGCNEVEVKVRYQFETPITFAVTAIDGAFRVTRSKPGYVCQSYVNCMPGIAGPGRARSPELNYCSQDYFTWAKTNCTVQPQIVQ